MTERCRVFPIPRGSPSTTIGTHNMELTPDGAVPASDHGAQSGSSDKLHYYLRKIIETKAPNGNPRQYRFVNKECYRYEDGVETLDATFLDVVQGAELFDTANGLILVAFFGTSTAIGANGGHCWRELGGATETSTVVDNAACAWKSHVGATAAQGWLAEASGADVAIVTGSVSQGRTTLGEHKVAKVLPGTWDGTVDNVGPAYPVGQADWPIVDLIGHGEGWVVGKGDGPYAFNQRGKKYQPLRPLQRRTPHGLNCKGMAASENGVFLPMNDGTVFEYIGGNLIEVTPWKDQPKPKDGPRGRVSMIADRGDVVVMVKEAWQNYVKGPRFAALGGRVFTIIGGVGAEITSGVTDGSFVTPAAANMNAWGGSVDDRLIVCSPFPLYGIIPRVTRNPNGNNCKFATPEVSDGAGAFTSLGTLRDATILSVANRSLVLTGFPPAAAEPALTWESKSAFYDAELEASFVMPTLGTITGPFYIYRLRPSSAGAMSTTTTIDELDVIEARPGLNLPASDDNSVFVAANDFSSLAASNMLVELYFGQRRGAGEYEWSTPVTLLMGAGVLSGAWTSAATGALTNGGMGLTLNGRFVQALVAEGPTRDPRRVPYPRLVQWGTSEPGPRLALRNMEFRLSNGDLAETMRPKRIVRFDINTRDVQGADLLQARVDHQDGRGAWKFGMGQGSPITIDNMTQGGSGRRADAYFLFADANQTDRIAPLIVSIDMEWEYDDHDDKDLDLATPAAD